MRVLFTSLRNTGHFQPLVPFIQACLRAGHEVAVATPSELAEQVKKAGARLFPVGHPGDAGLGPLWARMRDASPADAVRIAVQEVFAGACAQAALPDLLEAIESFRPEVLVREGQEWAAVIAAEKTGLRHVRVAITLRERDTFPFANVALEKHRAAHGLAPDPEGRGLLAESVLTRFPASFDPEASQASVQRFRAPRNVSPKGLPGWWQGSSDPLVYLTLGTVATNTASAHAAYRTALEAVASLPVRVLFTTGGDLPEEILRDVPAHVHVERFIPQDELLPHARAVLCHGGSGTVIGTLAAGVPLVVMPLFADQPQNAERVVHTGVGLAVPAPASAEALRAALSRVLAEPAFAAAAARMRDEIAGLPEVDQSVRVLAGR